MDGTFSDQTSSRSDAARYIAAMAGELARMAGHHNLSVLRYLLELAREEANSVTLSEGNAEAGE